MAIARLLVSVLGLSVSMLTLTSNTTAQQSSRSAPPTIQGKSALHIAYLDIDARYSGNTDSELTVSFPIADDSEVNEALSRALGCPLAHWRAESEYKDGVYAVAGNCPLIVKTVFLKTTGTIDFSALRYVLAKKSVGELLVDFHVENGQFLNCLPSPFKASVLDRSNECIYRILVSGADVSEIQFSYGYRPVVLLETGTILGAVLLFPIPFTLWLRRKAVRVPEANREAIWFAYLRYRVWGMTGGFLLWWLTIDLLGVGRLYSYALGNSAESSGPLSVLLPWIAVWIPPAVVYTLSNSLSAPIHKITGTERTEGEIVRQSAWAGANLIVPLSFLIAGISLISYSERTAALCFFAWFFTFFYGRTKLVRASGLEPHALTVGELRDRAFSIAAKAHVRLNQVYVLPAQRLRMANAFAHSKENILLTDYLLRNLSRREVDAVLGHEITHLQRKHSRAYGMLLLIGLGIFGFTTAWLNSFLPERFPTGPLFVLALLLMIYLLSRCNEFSADNGSVKLTTDPEAMITALIKISRLNMLPIHWNRLNESAMTHPSTMRRISAIAKTSGVALERIPQLIGETTVSPVETYSLPMTVAPLGKVFSTGVKRNVQNFYAWTSIFSFSVVPATVALALATAGPQNEHVWTLHIVGFLIALAVSLAIADRSSMHGLSALARGIRRKAINEGTSTAIAEGLFVGLAPDATARVYENNWLWDVGLLALTRDRLIYWGEETRFSLTRAQITRIALGTGPANWFRTPSVYVSWRADSRVEKTFNLRPVDAHSLSKMGKLTRALSRDLDDWHIGRATEPDSSVSAQAITEDELILPAPAFGQVSSRSIRSLFTPRTLCLSSFWVGAVAFGVAVIFGLHFLPDDLPARTAAPLAGWYVLCSAWLLNLIHIAPCIWRREPRARTSGAPTVGSAAPPT